MEANYEITICAIATSIIFNLATCNSASNKTTDNSDKFTPKLDTENYNNFNDVLSKLKDTGYIPIHGSAVHVYSELAINMMLQFLIYYLFSFTYIICYCDKYKTGNYYNCPIY